MPLLRGKPSRARLVAALMVADEGLIKKALSLLEPVYGSVELSSAVFPFTYSDYYQKEMGETLLKVFCSFRNLIDPAEIVGLKLAAIECEKSFLKENTGQKRPDPRDEVDQEPVASRRIDCQEPAASPQAVSASAGDRSVNIDPGYVDRTKLVLATTKDSCHRIYLGQGIYGDVELIYKSGGFAFLEWTYPDYRAPLAIEFFNKVRTGYLAELRETGPKPQL